MALKTNGAKVRVLVETGIFPLLSHLVIDFCDLIVLNFLRP